MSDKDPNEGVEIVVVPGETKKKVSATERKKIERVVRDNLLQPSKEPYQKVQVEVTRLADGKPQSIVASMLRRHTYTADIVKLNLDPDYNVTSVDTLSSGH